MNSFYGGKQGASFIITQWFKSEEDMKAAIQNGLVNYGEYVMVIGDDDGVKGTVYVRDDSDERGYRDICNLAGPSGGVQMLSLGSYKKIAEEYPNGYPKKDVNKPFETYVETGSYDVDLVPGYVPGEAEEGDSYQNTIDWIAVNNPKEDFKSSSTTIGLKIPYPVLEMELGTLTKGSTQTTLEKISDKKNLFYHKWKLNLPDNIVPLPSVAVATKDNINEVAAKISDNGILFVLRGDDNA